MPQLDTHCYDLYTHAHTTMTVTGILQRASHFFTQLWNCQWMVDFAALYGKTPEEVFTLICCDPSKIKVRPKDKDKVNAASVISELDPFVECALQLAVIDRD